MGIPENIEIIRRSIGCYNEKSIYNKNVTLVAVSKTHSVDMIKEAYDAGIRDFGENKVQELLKKIPMLPDDIRWHFIGHLQTNKVKQIIDKVYMIHSVDSLHLAEKIDAEAKIKGYCPKLLVEINVSEEESKFGIRSDEVFDVIKKMSYLKNIKIYGLMTVAPYTLEPEENRQFFSMLNKLSIDIKGLNLDNISMEHLSMGMSGDYGIAIEEGSDFVRIGTGIFGSREYQIS